MSKVIVQFNEANFDLIKKYCLKYNLKNINEFLDKTKSLSTYAEDDYVNLEPWIQWYSFYTNKSFKDHGVFHLNKTIKETENNFLSNLADTNKIGIFGSMNLPFNKKYKIYIPDPWSTNSSDETINSYLVSSSISQLVNSNARMKINLSSIIGILILFGTPKKLKDIKILFKIFSAFLKKDRVKLASYFDYLFLKYSLLSQKNNNRGPGGEKTLSQPKQFRGPKDIVEL